MEIAKGNLETASVWSEPKQKRQLRRQNNVEHRNGKENCGVNKQPLRLESGRPARLNHALQAQRRHWELGSQADRSMLLPAKERLATADRQQLHFAPPWGLGRCETGFEGERRVSVSPSQPASIAGGVRCGLPSPGAGRLAARTDVSEPLEAAKFEVLTLTSPAGKGRGLAGALPAGV